MNKNIKHININKQIKDLRLKMGLTQNEFALKVGTTRAMLGQIETFVANPTLELVINILKECSLSFDELIDETFTQRENTLEKINNDLTKENELLKKEIDLKDQIIKYQKIIINNLPDASK